MRRPACLVRTSVTAAALAAALLATALPTCQPAHAQRVLAREQVFHRSTDAGEERRVFTYAQYHRDCQPDDPPRIVLRVPPEHGSMVLRPRPSTVTAVREGGYDCSGHTYPGIAVVYVPAPGFHGNDRFEWDVVNRDRTSHDTAIIEVR